MPVCLLYLLDQGLLAWSLSTASSPCLMGVSLPYLLRGGLLKNAGKLLVNYTEKYGELVLRLTMVHKS